MGYGGKLREQAGARALRAAGWTYAEIAADLRVSKSSVSLWCRDVEVDPDLLDDRRRARWLAGNRDKRPSSLHVAKLAEIERCRTEAADWLGDLSDRDLFIAGIAQYAGEGTKAARNGVGFANTDPRMVDLFLTWFRRFFVVDESRLRVRIYLHEGLDIDAANEFWSRVTGVPTSQFHAPYRAKADPTIRRARHEHGCVGIVYASTPDQRRVLGLVEALLSPWQINPG